MAVDRISAWSGRAGLRSEPVNDPGTAAAVEEQEEFPVCDCPPQCPANEYWIPSIVDELIPEITGNYKIDFDRIYLTGISMGGYGTCMTAIEHPDRFAALAPICGGGDPGTVSAIKDVPVWAFHGAKDPVVPVTESEMMVSALKKAGGRVEFTVYPEGRHDVWTETYNNQALYNWLLSHSRKERVLKRKVS